MSNGRVENRIDYVELPATNLERTKQFYSGVFGWTFQDYGPEYVAFSDGRLEGGFTTRAAAPCTNLLLIFYSADLQAAQQKITTAGGTIIRETFSFPGGRRFHFADPNGNVLAVWSDAGV